MSVRVYKDLTHAQLLEIWRELEQQHKPTVLFHNAFTPAVTSWGVSVDDGSTAPESTTLAVAEDTTYDVDVSSGNVQLFLFIQIEEQGDDTASGSDAQLQFDPNGGTSWSNVTAVTSGIFGTADADTAANDLDTWATSSFKLTGEEGTAEDGAEFTDDMTGSTPTFGAGNYQEEVFCITVDAANVSDNDTITFAVAIGGTTITNDVTPTITITKGASSTPISADVLGLGTAALGPNTTYLTQAATAAGVQNAYPGFVSDAICGAVGDGPSIVGQINQTGGGLVTRQAKIDLSQSVIGAGLAALSKFFDRTYAAVAGGLVALTKVLPRDFDVIAGGLVTRAIKANLQRIDLAGGIPQRAIKVHKQLFQYAAGLVDVVVNNLATLTPISADAVAGAVLAVQKKINLTRTRFGGAVLARVIRVNLSRADIAAGLSTSVPTVYQTFTAIAGGLVTIAKKINLQEYVIGAGVVTRAAKIFKNIVSLAGGKVEETVTFISGAADPHTDSAACEVKLIVRSS